MNFFPQSPHELTAVSFNWNVAIVCHSPVTALSG